MVAREPVAAPRVECPGRQRGTRVAHQAHEQSIQSLKKGDEVVTAGGIVGKVVHIRETLKDGQAVKSADDQVTIESGTSRLVVERGRIAKIRGAATGAPNA